ncbi:hypothetical protein BaRGS_00022633 [Batillaria attramentaria]|uniref:Uncharacterized protein n=1 Tax=Batillaria attramentaria TaxID=370345 RepID=A0ABD0KGI5_9CAEN
MFVSVEPQITGQTGSGGETGSATNGRTGSLLERVVWPAVFCLAYVPASFECVIFERELRREAKSFEDFGQRLFRGISCGFSSHPDCHGLPFRSWLFIVTYNLAATFQFLLIQVT